MRKQKTKDSNGTRIGKPKKFTAPVRDFILELFLKTHQQYAKLSGEPLDEEILYLQGTPAFEKIILAERLSTLNKLLLA